MENNEEILMQKVHELKISLDTEKSLRLDCQHENERLQLELTETKSQVDSVKAALGNEIRSLKDKIINLTNDAETEKLSYEEKISELEQKLRSTSVEKPSNNDDEEHKKLMNDLYQEKQRRDEIEDQFFCLKETMVAVEIEKAALEQKLKDSKQHSDELREALEIKKENLTETLAALKEAQEEKALLSSEVATLKAGPVGDLERGNSLFKEVEDNRKKLASAYTTLKNKYIAVQNIISVKNQQINRLEREVTSLKAKDIGIEQALQDSKSRIYENMKKRIVELEATVGMMEKWKESPQILTISQSDIDKLQWINSMVTEARNETRRAIAQYQQLSSDQMEKAVLLRKNELELMNLKVELLKKEGIIGKLELEIVDLKKEAKENVPLHNNTIQGDNTLRARSGNKTVRFLDSEIEETLCGQEGN